MAPLPKHGKDSDVLSDLVKALLRHQGRDWESLDPITLKRFGEAGVEPDCCDPHFPSSAASNSLTKLMNFSSFE